MSVACSCGVPDCCELGWPHEWDPIAAGDSCILARATPWDIVIRDDQVITRYKAPHAVTEPYVRTGSGYACRACLESA